MNERPMPFESLKQFLQKKIQKEDYLRAFGKIIDSQLWNKKVFFVGTITIFVFLFYIQHISHFYTWDTDLPSFYTAARGILQNINIYDQQEFQKLVDSFFGKSTVVFPYLYSPVLAQILSLFSFLDYALFSQLFLIINLVLTLFCVYLTYILLDLKTSKSKLPLFFLLLTIVINNPLETTLHHGQINILVFGIVLLSFLLLKHKKEYAASLFMCFAVYLKIYPVLFFVLFFFQKRYKYLFYSAINFILIFLLSIVFFPSHTWLEFSQMAANNFLYGKKTEFFFDYNAQWGNCSLNGFFSQLFMIINIPRKFVMPTIISLLIALFFLLRSQLRKIVAVSETNIPISFVFILSLVLSTISWNHHFVIMIFPLAYLFNRIILERRYNYLIPFILVASQILYHPRTGGFPFNQILLVATLLFLLMLLYFHFKKKPETFLKQKT